ncbi:MAG TPA: hypothetical protein VMV92_04145 [Streptosporangiaceae bacterium]|nr:hypothetical protein [Streptosporangiaceae bacterium]
MFVGDALTQALVTLEQAAPVIMAIDGGSRLAVLAAPGSGSGAPGGPGDH